jgi:predicted AAA+ superfamily ATPase
MNIKNRCLSSNIIQDLNEKMVFVAGPRQVGKTTLAQKIIGKNFKKFSYYNWDNRNDRRMILNSMFKGDSELLIFDEIHKYPEWKNFLKGEYDKLKEKYKFLITGSARLDIFRKGSDSLMGRYFYYRLHPFSLSELLDIKNNNFKPFKEILINSESNYNELETLIKFGGFPEVLFKQSEKFLRRWHNHRIDRLFKEDIRDMENIKEMVKMEIMTDILPEKVGALLSLNSLAEDVGVSFKAVNKWIDVLESFYYCFRIYPYSKNILYSLKKMPKLYLWDWSEIVNNESARFENLIASHLLKFVHYLYDAEGYNARLHYLRDSSKREVDFLVTVNDKPWFAVEVKLNDLNISKNLLYFQKKLNIPFVYQIVKMKDIDLYKFPVRIISADKFLVNFV